MRLLSRSPKQPSRHAKPPVVLGIVGAVALIIGTYFAFTKRVPLKEGYRVEAVFKTSAGLRKSSPVRIAGVEVGKVVGFEDGPDATRIVEIQIEDHGRPIHSDATLRIRPRLFLEGGYYVELSPGSPSAPEIDDGGTVPLPQTSIPVQFDQVLGVLRAPVRDSMRTIVEELDRALDDGGAEAAAQAMRPLSGALRDGSIVFEAARGSEERDVSRLVSGAARATKALASRQGELASLVTGLARTTTALASESAGLRATVRELDGVLGEVPASFRAIDDVLPATDAFLAESRPGLRRARTVLPGVERLLTQLELASGQSELRGLVADLRRPLRTLPTLTDRLTALFPLVTPVTDCVLNNALPVLEAKVDDGALSTGRTVWQNLTDAAVGLAGASGNFDGNGTAIRYLFTGGENSVNTGAVPGLGTLTGAISGGTLGSSPRWLGPGRRPPYRPDAACADQKPPDLKARSRGAVIPARKATVRNRSTTVSELRKALTPKRLDKILRGAGVTGRGGR
jgi:virulence factor Mce-like protein